MVGGITGGLHQFEVDKTRLRLKWILNKSICICDRETVIVV